MWRRPQRHKPSPGIQDQVRDGWFLLSTLLRAAASRRGMAEARAARLRRRMRDNGDSGGEAERSGNSVPALLHASPSPRFPEAGSAAPSAAGSVAAQLVSESLLSPRQGLLNKGQCHLKQGAPEAKGQRRGRVLPQRTEAEVREGVRMITDCRSSRWHSCAHYAAPCGRPVCAWWVWLPGRTTKAAGAGGAMVFVGKMPVPREPAAIRAYRNGDDDEEASVRASIAWRAW